MNYLIAETNISFSPLSPEMAERMKKYERNDLPSDCFCEEEIVESLSLPEEEPFIRAKYYSVYQFGDHKIQYLWNEEKVLMGSITYKGDHVSVAVTKGNVYLKEYVLTETAGIYFILNHHDALFIHSSSFAYKDKGVLLIANSGTGKSTHARLWNHYDDIIQINDDKNTILSKENQLFIYPNPWSGKHAIDTNVIKPLTHLVFVHRGLDNTVTRLSPMQTFLSVLPHIQNTSFYYAKEKWDKMTRILVEKSIGLKLSCDISENAYLALKKAITED